MYNVHRGFYKWWDEMCKFPVKLLCKVGASTHNLSFCCQRGAKNTPTIYFTKVNMGSASQLNSGPLISVSQVAPVGHQGAGYSRRAAVSYK